MCRSTARRLDRHSVTVTNDPPHVDIDEIEDGGGLAVSVLGARKLAQARVETAEAARPRPDALGTATSTRDHVTGPKSVASLGR